MPTFFRITNYELRIMVFVLSMILASLFMIHPVYAQAPSSTSKEKASFGTKPTFEVSLTALPPTVSPTSPLYTDLLLNNMFHSFSCLAIGSSVIGQPCLTYQITKNAQGAIQSVPMLSQVNLSGGTLGAVSSLIGALYLNPPVRTADYLASVGQDLGLVKEAHAQVVGSGANVLSPIIKLWQVSRNVSYVIMIIIFVVIGLMVMFRQKINPQTVITAQAALPGLVIGLILITFSYFLAGLISDMAFVGTNVVGYYFQAAESAQTPPSAASPPLTSPLPLTTATENENAVSIFSKFLWVVNPDRATDAINAIWDNLGGWPQIVLRVAAGFLVANFASQSTAGFTALPGIGAPLQVAATLIAGSFALLKPQGTIGFALAFIATLVLIYSMFKLLLRLINNFLSIIFLTITAPFHFLAASLPGRQGMATNWVRNMLCNVLVFPAVMAIFYFVAFLTGKSEDVFHISKTIEITGTSALPLLGGFKLDFINTLLAFGALVALPAVPDIICRTIGKMGEAGQLLGRELSVGVGAGRGYFGQFQQGVGTASGQVAKARGLFDTPGQLYREGRWINVNANTEVTEEEAFRSGFRGGAIRRAWGSLSGGLKKPTTEPTKKPTTEQD